MKRVTTQKIKIDCKLEETINKNDWPEYYFTEKMVNLVITLPQVWLF